MLFNNNNMKKISIIIIYHRIIISIHLVCLWLRDCQPAKLEGDRSFSLSTLEILPKVQDEAVHLTWDCS